MLGEPRLGRGAQLNSSSVDVDSPTREVMREKIEERYNWEDVW